MTPTLDDQSVTFLTQECDRLLSLYSEAQSNTQSVFNFYLTFLTTVVGAVVIIIQTGSGIRTPLLIMVLLFFAALVGSVYLSAIAFRYARSKRSAEAVDEIRTYLIHQQNLQLPEIYAYLKEPPAQPKAVNRIMWLFPSGTYQMFIAFVNSAALSICVLLVAIIGGSSLELTTVAAILIFILTQLVYNAYAQLILRRFGHGITVSTGSSALWAGRN